MKKIIILLLFSGISISLFSQSRYLENGTGGSCFTFKTSFGQGGLNSFGASAAYSIGGIMDIGFLINRENGLVEGYDSTEWNFNFLYNVIIIKQSDFIPLSLQLEGKYGYANISSDYLTNTDKTLEGQGFNAGISLFREFNKKGFVSVLVGAKANYRNFMMTEVDYALTSTTTERQETLLWGGIAGVSIRPENWPIFTVELEVLYDQLAGGVFIEPSILIISPSY